MVFGEQSFKIDLWDYGTASNHAPNIFFRDAEAAIVFVDLSSPEEQLSDIYTKAYEWRSAMDTRYTEVNGSEKPLKWMICLHKSDAIQSKEHRKVISSKLNKIMKVNPKFDQI